MPNEAPQLHELLAAEPELASAASKILSETRAVFKTGGHIFRGSTTSYAPFSVDEAHLAAEENEPVASTVEARLKYTARMVAKYWDAVLQKETTNQSARADLVVQGATIAQDVPATMLLGLETKLRQFRDAISNMPTLDNKTEWVPEPSLGAHMSRAVHPEEKFRTRKVTKPVVLYEATEHHPANVIQAVEDIHIGKITKKLFSGEVTSARKADVLERTDMLIRAAKKARQRANKEAIVKGKIGAEVFKFILQDAPIPE